MELQGKICVLTGASGGIGQAFARALADAGVMLLLVGRNRDKLEQLRSGLPGSGHHTVIADLATAEGRQAVSAACDGRLDILVNGAGVNHFGLLTGASEQQLRQMMEVNVLAPMLLVQELLPVLESCRGAVVNVGSGYGSIGYPGYCGYSASKFALRGFTEALRRELADSPVEVCYLAPRATATAMNPAEVVALNEELGNATDSPERVAAELITLLRKSQPARYVGWPEKFFVRLNGLFPSLVDGALAKQLPAIRRQALAAASRYR